MSNAPNYTPTVGFATEETNSVAGRSTVRTVAIDNELANISSSINGLNTNIKKLQRDDGKILDGIIEPYQLSEQSRALITSGGTPKGNWTINTNYEVGDAIQYSSIVYLCVIAHNSGSAFISGVWMALSGDGSSFASAQDSAASAASSLSYKNSALTYANAAESSAALALSYKNSANTSSTNAYNSYLAADAARVSAESYISNAVAPATQSDAESGLDNSKYMSALRVKQAITFNAPSASQAEMEAGTEAAIRSMSPLRIKQAINALGGNVGADVTSSASNVTLTTTSKDIQNVSITTTQKKVLLPDATTLTVGKTFKIINTGANDFSIAVSDGSLIDYLELGEEATYTLTGNATADGKWHSTKLSGIASVKFKDFNVVDASLDLNGTSTIYDVCWLKDVNKVLVLYVLESDSFPYVKCGSISSGIITWGAATLVQAVALTGETRIGYLGNNLALLKTSDRVHGVSLSGTTCTIHASTTTHGASGRSFAELVPLTATTALYAYPNNVTAGSETNGFKIVTYSGTAAPTFGTAQTVNTDATGDNFQSTRLFKVSSTKVNAIYQDNVSGTLQCITLTISGTSITKGTIYAFSTLDLDSVTSSFEISSGNYIIFGSYSQGFSGTTFPVILATESAGVFTFTIVDRSSSINEYTTQLSDNLVFDFEFNSLYKIDSVLAKTELSKIPVFRDIFNTHRIVRRSSALDATFICASYTYISPGYYKVYFGEVI